VASLDNAPQRSGEEKKYHLLKKYTPPKKKKRQASINIDNHNPTTYMIKIQQQQIESTALKPHFALNWHSLQSMAFHISGPSSDIRRQREKSEVY
jgi:hypothetical protein